MERRLRPRVTPLQKAKAYLDGSNHPAQIVDYSAYGMGVVTSGKSLRPGSPVSVDLVVNEKLCACSMPGTVRWSYGNTAGIRLDNPSDHQMKQRRDVEMRMLYG